MTMSDGELDELESDFDVQDSELSDGEVEEARSAIAAGKDSADRLMAASRELESIVYGVVQDETNSLAGTELDILVCENFIMYKEKQEIKEEENVINRAFVI